MELIENVDFLKTMEEGRNSAPQDIVKLAKEVLGLEKNAKIKVY